jgi:hypothetical protein
MFRIYFLRPCCRDCVQRAGSTWHCLVPGNTGLVSWLCSISVHYSPFVRVQYVRQFNWHFMSLPQHTWHDPTHQNLARMMTRPKLGVAHKSKKSLGSVGTSSGFHHYSQACVIMCLTLWLFDFLSLLYFCCRIRVGRGLGLQLEHICGCAYGYCRSHRMHCKTSLRI